MLKFLKIILIDFLIILAFYCVVGYCEETTTVTLAWDKYPTTDITGYKLYQSSTEHPKNWVLVADIPYTGSDNPTKGVTVTVPSRKCTRFWYALTAYNQDGESGYSNIVSNDIDYSPQKYLRILIH